MVTSYMTLMVRLDDERFTYGDIAHFNGMVTAIRNGSAALQNIYDAWCRRHNLQVQLLYFDDNSQALNALLDGRADSMVIGGAYALDKTRTVAQFHRMIPFLDCSFQDGFESATGSGDGAGLTRDCI